ncbi:response regulator receiver protein [Halothece sp. PCC 7418]|uniref:response regulator n=1 Tax=Halothece sp. (strain PCC 7418) TaxID=65093 RepID=UPI0002A06394|nr:response regulator [Halothece sp. PCC 7418]AFZ42698.1 response regulator receiver protein [Halothece sp. PCC 7418]
MMTKDQLNGQQQQKTVDKNSEIAEKTFLELEELLEEIVSSSQQQFTGRLTLKTPDRQQWQLYFGMGRLLWASGGEHPRRRWRRQLAHVCEQDGLKGHYSEGHLREGDHYECWDFHLLLALHKRKILSSEQVRKVMVGMITEILFDLNHQGIALCTSKEAYPDEPNHCGKQVFTRTWKAGVRPSQEMVVPPSWGVETQACLDKAQESWVQWREMGLTHVSPNQAPQLLNLKELAAQTSEKVYGNLVKLVTGDRTLRDLSVVMKMSPLKLARSLQPYIRQDLITLAAIADLPPAPQEKTVKKQQLQRRAEDQSATTSSPIPSQKKRVKSQRPLVAFVDDSEQSRNIMNNVVTKGGYDFIGIGDSVQAITILLEKQPQLIFLDLMMPNVNGYELCSQIRKISVLKDVPVVIVTGNDGIVDRMRAKVVGANNFISKPIDRSEVLTLALQYTQSASAK